MPALSINEAAERLANVVEKAKPTILSEIYVELFPEKPATGAPPAANLAQYVRSGLEAEELVSLWNVVFPADRNVWYDEEDQRIRYNEEAVGYAEAD
jgi:hypothetical protein